MKKFFSQLCCLILVLASLLCTICTAAAAEEQPPVTINVTVNVDPSNQSAQTTVAAASSSAAAVSPAIAIFQHCLPSVVKIETNGGGGSGFFISEELVVTNRHVIADAQWVNVTNSDGHVFSASKILAQSEQPDLALLEVPGANGMPVEFVSRTLLEGEAVYAMGNPMGIYPCIFDGIVVKSKHNEGNTRFILSNINTLQGNSGGPVFDAEGKLIGVVVGSISDGTNAIDLVINADHIPEMQRNQNIELRTEAEFAEEQNRPDEEKYEKVALDQARVGALVSFGRYEQDNDPANGEEDILWLVMEEHEDHLVLMSLYCLDAMPYSLDSTEAGWENSSVRAFLNGEFYQSAFNADEQRQIRDTQVVTPDNPVYGTFNSAGTVDKVYLMDHYEAMRYFDIPEASEDFYPQTAAQATPYTMTKDVWLEIPGSPCCWMWLRSNGSTQANAGEIGSRGYLSFNGGSIDQIRALRPLIQIDKP